jgi:GDPmannose 4,6-dehydratase
LSRIKLGLQKELILGNLNAKRDWGHAQDYAEAMWKMMQLKKPDDFVIATGKQYSVRDFVNISAKNLGILIKWVGKGINEKGIEKKTGKTIVRVGKRYFRPTEVDTLLGDARKAKKILKWKPKITFNQMVKEMIESDYNNQKNDLKT